MWVLKDKSSSYLAVFFVNCAALLEKKFYVIGFEYMIQLEKSETDFDYWPVEVGIVEWSMAGGISREFYRLIYPGQ